MRSVARTFKAACILMLAASGPAFGQVDLAGEWAVRVHEDQPERGPGPSIGEYSGLPLNAAARQRAERWDASVLTLPELQCVPHPANYSANHSNLRIWKDMNEASQQVTSWRLLWE
jgi:hypothetical protein